ncbi:MAG: hypothetical protein CNLJKLNK_00813 [Holosporales bacterium]
MKQRIIALGIASLVVSAGAQTSPSQEQPSQASRYVSVSAQTELNPNAKPYKPISILPASLSSLQPPGFILQAEFFLKEAKALFKPERKALFRPAASAIDTSTITKILRPKRYTPLRNVNDKFNYFLTRGGASLDLSTQIDLRSIDLWNQIKRGMDENGRGATFVCNQFVSGLECYTEILKLALNNPQQHKNDLRQAFFELFRMLPVNFAIEIHGKRYGKLECFNKFIETMPEYFDIFQTVSQDCFSELTKNSADSIQVKLKTLDMVHTFTSRHEELLIRECNFLNKMRTHKMLERRSLFFLTYSFPLNKPNFSTIDYNRDMTPNILFNINRHPNNPQLWDELGDMIHPKKPPAPPRKFYFDDELYTSMRCYTYAFLIEPTQARFAKLLAIKKNERPENTYFFNTAFVANFKLRNFLTKIDNAMRPAVQPTYHPLTAQWEPAQPTYHPLTAHQFSHTEDTTSSMDAAFAQFTQDIISILEDE